MVYEERLFFPFRDAKQILILRLDEEKSVTFDGDDLYYTCLLDVYGKMFIVEKEISLELNDLVSHKCSSPTHSLELVCADVSMEQENGIVALLATSWVELNENCIPQRCFGAMFFLEPDFKVRLMETIELSMPTAFFRLTGRFPNTQYQHCWMIFEGSREMRALFVNIEKRTFEPIADLSPLFPELAHYTFPGSVISSSCSVRKDYRWSLKGLDTGHAIISVASVLSKDFIGRKTIRFASPVSVAVFFPTDNERSRRFAISSTLGPVAVWRADISENDELSCQMLYFLDQSQLFDAITTAVVVNESIAIGTFSGRILFYPHAERNSKDPLIASEILEIHAPVVTLKAGDDKSLCALSTSGLHVVAPNVSDSED